MELDQVEAAPSKQLTAVTVRGLKLSYSRTGPPVIDDANMTIPNGAIYGLLGASGCGKTSLLKCLVGLCKPNAGNVLIYGQELHTGLVPGPGVGFMPQELALHQGFTIAENMYFFGQLLGMPTNAIFQRINFLCSFFELLPADRFVERLSGGQQRRTSLAVALMHEPPFLILDEPTVGLDPVLRAAIWHYFLNLSNEQHTTLLVTTHFIEEIAEANVVGLMKNGKIWCEQTPAELMQAYGVASLSDTYLKICEALAVPGEVKPGDEKPKEALDVPGEVKPGDEKPKEALDGNPTERGLSEEAQLLLGPLMEEAKLLPKPRLAPSPQVTFCPVPNRLLTWSHWGPVRSIFRTRAIVIKNALKIMRRLITVVIQLVVPSFVGIIFCLFVGGNPTYLPVAVVNEDPDGEYSHLFLDEISTEIVTKKPYDNLQSSFQAVLDESAWGSIHIPANYTDLMKTRIFNFTRSSRTVTAASTLNFFVDATDCIVRDTLRVEIIEAHLRYIKDISRNFTGQNFSIQTIRFSDPFYQAFNYTYRESRSPAIIITTVFVLPMALTTLLLVAEQQEGIRARSIVSGVTLLEVILGHAIVQMAMAYMQTVLMLVVFVVLFGTPVRGSHTAAFFLPVFMAMCGMCFGFLASAASKDEGTALLLSMSCLYPTLLMGGVLWPVEGAPQVLRPVSLAVPQAMPAHALQGVMLRNYTMDNPIVLQAFFSISLWTIIYIIATLVVFAFFK